MYLNRRLLVNGFVVEVSSWNSWPSRSGAGIPACINTTLAQEPIRALAAESLLDIQQQGLILIGIPSGFLKRMEPYTADLIQLFFNDTSIDRAAITTDLQKLSQDFKENRRGVGSRSSSVNIDELLAARGIDLQTVKKPASNVRGRNRIGVCIQPFSVDLNSPKSDLPKTGRQLSHLARGFLNEKKIQALSTQFEHVYLLSGVEWKAWLLVEPYLKEFLKPIAQLENGEGYIKRYYVSPRKYIAPAKVNIKLTDLGYSAWVPFGCSQVFPSFESAIEEIHSRLHSADLPGLKLSFKKESIEK
jgi:hypothetical protein